jgi:PAS domain-containing protein
LPIGYTNEETAMLHQAAFAPTLGRKTIVLPPPCSIQDGLLGLDRNLVIVACDAAAAALFGYDRDQMIGMPLSQLIPGAAWPDTFSRGPEALAWSTLRFSRVGLEATHAEEGSFTVTASLCQDADGGLFMRIRKFGS